jgi:hypothetical protein
MLINAANLIVGNPATALTPPGGDSSTRLATTAYVVTALGNYALTSSLSTYLTTVSASSTYLTISTASSTYATIASLSSYLTASSAGFTYAPLASPTFTGIPAVPTATGGTNTTQAASTAFVTTAISSLNIGNYLTIVSAGSTYLTQISAANTYATQTSLSSYALTSSLSAYLTTATAASTYALTTSLGTIASQNANSVLITGGSIDNVSVGNTNANSGVFTQLQSTLTTLQQGSFSTIGDAQTRSFILRGTSTTATATEIFYGSTNNSRLVLSNSTAWLFEVQIVGRRIGVVGESISMKLEGLITRDANALSTSQPTSALKTYLYRSSTNWDANIVTDTTNGAMALFVTGEVSKTIQWVARVILVEVTG